ncbi:DNA repair protein endonuclease SAE2/CtIP C-terminus-domain-containing protein, partial [Hysterangium stoloniferum]
TINGEFEIDPEKNRGTNFQYEAVVRDKAERKQLEGGDCECCREYYEAVGPLPPGLRAPLWRSPSSEPSQRQTRPCRYKTAENDVDLPFSSPLAKTRKKAIGIHKNNISRHRHDWAPPATPPDFWKIGFPDTQEVEEINRRADNMHTRKFKLVEAQVQYVHFLFLISGLSLIDHIIDHLLAVIANGRDIGHFPISFQL